MDVPLASARAKVDRAREQASALQAEFGRLIGERAYTITQTLDRETGKKTAVFHARPLDPRWPVILGEIVHDLRSALDSAVYDLTVAEQGRPLDHTEFPVFEDESKYDATNKDGSPRWGSGVYKVRGINAAAKGLIRDLQPFEFRKHHAGDEQPVVALVHELNIIDKHRSVHLVRQETDQFEARVVRDIQPVEEWVFPLGKIEDGAVLGSWVPTITDDEPDMEFTIDFEIVLADTVPALDGQAVSALLEILVRGVEKLIFEYLAPTVAGPAEPQGSAPST